MQYAYATGASNTIRRTRITSPNGTAINTAYDSTIASALSRPDKVTEGASSPVTVATFKYLGLNTPIEMVYNNNPGTPSLNAQWTMKNGSTGEAGDGYTGLDRFGRLVETLWKNSGGNLVNTTYGRNRFGGVRWKRDVLAHAAPLNLTTEDNFYWYDGLQQNYLHRRGNLSGTAPNYTGITNVQQTEIRSFDETGNWLSDEVTCPRKRGQV